MRVLSLGAGVQSTTLLLASLTGGDDGRWNLPPLDAAIFADTGWEPQAVYRHLAWLVAEVDERVPIYRVTQGNIAQDTLRSVTQPGSRNESALTLSLLCSRSGVLVDLLPTVLPGNRASKRIASMPFHVRNREGEHAMLRRQCTGEYKIEPIHAALRFLTGRKPRQRKGPAVEQWVGISLDEWQRMGTSRTPWISLAYPLVERRLTREDCVRWLTSHGYPIPPKSSCKGCPFHDNRYWRRLRDESPDEWGEVVAFDATIRNLSTQGVDAPAYLHRSLVPLSEVDLRTHQERSGQQSLLPLLDDELVQTGGVCTSGYCFEDGA